MPRAASNRFVYPDVGKRLKKIRHLAGHPGRQQNKFAESHGFSPGAWNHYEKGKNFPWQNAVRLLESLEHELPGLTLDYIYRGDLRGIPFDLVKRLGG